MIKGIVTADHEAVVLISVLGASGRRKSVEAIIDTGFDGYLSLPSSIIESLRLRWRDRRWAVLADGSETVFDAYHGSILWDRRRCRISIHEADSVPLIGMALLEGFELRIVVKDGGGVTIKRLRR